MGDIRYQRGKICIRWYDGHGKRRQQATNCKTEREARALIREREAEAQAVRDGRLVQPLGATDEQRRQKTITVAELVAHFLGDVDGDQGYASPTIKNLATYRGDARSAFKMRIAPTLGHRIAATVTAGDVERLRDALAGKYAGATVTQTLAVLSKVYNWGRRVSLIACVNPAQGIERPRAEHSIDFLDRDEVTQLLAVAQDLAAPGVASWQSLVLYPMVATAVYCGLRKGELFGLRWIDVHLDVQRIDVNRSYRARPKSGKPRHVRINGELLPILRAWKKACPSTGEGLVFPVEAPSGTLLMGQEQDTLALGDLLEIAECHEPADGKPWHFLRHTFASHYVMAGGSLLALQKILGHAKPDMTQRYAHLAPDYLAAEVERLSFAARTPGDVASIDEARRQRGAG